MVTVALAGSDCEALHNDWLGQPVNTVSSLAYVVAAGYVLRKAGPRPVALALAAVGVGSALYHGSAVSVAEVAHNGSMVLLAIAVAFSVWQGALRRPPIAAVAVFVAAIVVNVLTRTDAPLCDPDSVFQGHAAWHVLTSVSAALWLTQPTDARAGAARREGSTGMVALAAAALYSWWASGLRSFTHPVAVAVAIPGAVVLVMVWLSRRRPAVRAVQSISGAGILLWAVVLAAILGWELLQYASSPRADHPTLSSMADRLLETHPARAGAFLAWLLLGRAISR